MGTRDVNLVREGTCGRGDTLARGEANQVEGTRGQGDMGTRGEARTRCNRAPTNKLRGQVGKVTW